MKKHIIKVLTIIIFFIIVSILQTFANSQLDLDLANISAKQLMNDGTYYHVLNQRRTRES